MNYIDAWKYESFGDHDFGIKIQIAVDRELTNADKRTLQQRAMEIHDAIMAETINLDPASRERAQKERQDILRVFGNAVVYVKEIPNGYCSQWCCRHLPWFVVTTSKGPITIGWRKRVIQIDWSEADGIDQTADVLFPNEDVTKYSRAIHAWGLEKAKEIVQVLLETK